MLETLGRYLRPACGTSYVARSPSSGNYALFDDVDPALDALTQGVVFGIVSNYEAWLEDLLVLLSAAATASRCAPISGIEGWGSRIAPCPGPRSRTPGSDRRRVRGRQPGVRRRSRPRARHDAEVLVNRRGQFPAEECITISDLRELPAVLGAAT